jgi:site-specific recombinase XerD
MLKLVNGKSVSTQRELKVYGAEAVNHHNQLIDGFVQSHRLRNHSQNTIEETKRFLNSWFITHGSESRCLLTWEVMTPVFGRQIIVNYSRALRDLELTASTARKYIGTLRSYFSFVLDHPYIKTGSGTVRVSDLYGPIEQPVSEYELPAHVYNGEQRGVPFEPGRILKFYEILRDNYINPSCKRYLHERARNYTMIVMAGETGLRADELSSLEIDHDLFFDSPQLQTRNAKGTRGSGKRTRLTVFPPLARDTVKYFIKNHREHLRGYPSPYLFFSTTSEPVDYNSLQRGIVSMRACANKNGFPILDHFAWHWMRRLFATRFIENFPDKLPVLIQLLGHVTGATVHAYIRHSKVWMDEQRNGVLEKIEDEFDPMEI